MKPEAFQLTRWIGDWMMDFASRANWCVTPRYADANHAPEVTVVEGLDLTVAPGETLSLHARGTDPDGDELSYRWFRYADADSCRADVNLVTDGPTCKVTIPADACPGDTVHLVCRVSDEVAGRDEYMVGYARPIIIVS